MSINFSADFNSPVVGKYSFNKEANIGVVLLQPLVRTSVYLLDRYSFSANVPEGSYLEGLQNTDQPAAQLRYQKDGTPIYQRPIPCTNYVDNAESLAYFYSQDSSQEQSQADKVLVDFRGELQQPFSLVGVTTIITNLSFSIYEVIDENWIRVFRERTKQLEQREVII